MPRTWQQYVFNFDNGQQISNEMRMLGGGCFGMLLVPAAFSGKTLQLITDLSDVTYTRGLTAANVAALNGLDLLTTPKTLATGKNAFTSAEIAEIGGAGPVKLKLNSAVAGAQQILLWWKD